MEWRWRWKVEDEFRGEQTIIWMFMEERCIERAGHYFWGRQQFSDEQQNNIHMLSATKYEKQMRH